VTEYPPYPQQQVSTAPFWPVFTLALAIAVYLGVGITPEPDFLAGAILVGLTFLSLFIFTRVSAGDPEAGLLFKVLVFAWLFKIGATFIRLHLILNVYGSGDALAYDQAGQTIAALLAQGRFPELPEIWGTEFVELFTGFLYLIIGPSLRGAFFLCAYLALIGMLLHYKAFVTAFPNGNRRLFMFLVFFYPSVIFWPGSLGKDSLIAFCLGLTAYGAARLYRDGMRLGTMLLLVLGLGGTLMVRPHVAAIAAVALVAVVLLRPIHAGMLTPFIRLGALALFGVLAALVVQTAGSFIGVEDLSAEEIAGFAEETVGQTAQGGSAFTPTGLPTSPQAVLLAVPNVLFRPYPWEARSLLMLASAAEGMLLAGLLLWRFRSVLRAILEARRHGYLAFSVVYAALFIFFFSVIGNFAILARQRVQVLPFVFVWIAYQTWKARAEMGTSPPQ